MMKTLRRFVFTAALMLVVLTLFAGFGWYRFGSVNRSLAYVRGERLFVDEAIKSLGQIQEDREQRVEFQLANHASRPISIVGVSSSCGCTGVEGVPMTIPRGVTRPLVVKVRLTASSNDAVTTLRVFTDDPGQPEMRLKVIAQMIPNHVPVAIR
ncbi:hypothetical protein BH23PLA1_BH23PLA1_14430 [soil metagenome]